VAHAAALSLKGHQMATWPKNESATGRGFTQGSESYNAADVARMLLEDERRAAVKRSKVENDTVQRD